MLVGRTAIADLGITKIENYSRLFNTIEFLTLNFDFIDAIIYTRYDANIITIYFMRIK
jgi:hypothetical protein